MRSQDFSDVNREPISRSVQRRSAPGRLVRPWAEADVRGLLPPPRHGRAAHVTDPAPLPTGTNRTILEPKTPCAVAGCGTPNDTRRHAPSPPRIEDRHAACGTRACVRGLVPQMRANLAAVALGVRGQASFPTATCRGLCAGRRTSGAWTTCRKCSGERNWPMCRWRNGRVSNSAASSVSIK